MHSQFQDEALKLDNSQLFSKSNKISSLIRTNKYQFYCKKALVVFILITLLSLLLSYFTGLSFLHSYTYYSSSFMIPYLITQTFERKYMFVLCNGILVFLAGLHNRTSCSSLSSEFQTEVVADTDDNIRDQMEEDLVLQPAAVFHPLSELEEEAPTAVAATEEERVLNEASQVVDIAEDGNLNLDEEIETENEEDSAMITITEEEGDTGPAGSNTEELNKKIEEFIRKMKEELQLQAQQHHIIAA